MKKTIVILLLALIISCTTSKRVEEARRADMWKKVMSKGMNNPLDSLTKEYEIPDTTNY